jgi:hypothetical protein
MEVVWKSYNDSYDVSSEGEVREKASGNLRRSYHCPNRDKMFVSLKDVKGKVRSFALSTVVSQAFELPRPKSSGIEHIDGNVQNCKPSNLKWISQEIYFLRNPRPTNTGEPFIVKHERTYTWTCAKKKVPETDELKSSSYNYERFEVTCGKSKEFKTLDEAVLHRDAFLENAQIW